MIVEDQLIGARFEKCAVERLIGRGGYGLTFLAFDDELREHRVIKVSLAWGDDDATRRRHEKSFIEEGLIISRLKHPQIVTLRAQGEKDGRRYMILDYIHGHNLKSLLDLVERRRLELGCAWGDLLSPAESTALVLSTLYPLAYAHSANVHLPDREIFGVAHRDISPGNLILGLKGNEKGNVILIDFGTAKTDLSDNFTVNHNLVGTVPYMGKARLQKAASPEQSSEYQAYWRSFRETQHDIHSLGVLYYQLLTGRLPFPGEATPQIIVKVLDPEVYSQLHVEMARDFPALAGIMEKCLVYHDFSLPYHEQPYQYPDAAAMLPDAEAAFRALAPGRTVRDTLIGLGEKLSRPENLAPSGLAKGRASSTYVATALPQPVYYPLPRRKSALPFLAALALAAAAAVGGAWLLRARSAKTPAEISRGPSAGAPPAAAAPAFSQAPGSADNLERLESLRGAEGPASPRPSASRKKPSEPGGKSAAAVAALQQKPPAVAAPVPELDKDVFVQLQTLVREDEPTAFDKLSEWLSRNPDSPDLLLLKCQLVLRRNPAAPETRADLASLLDAHPVFTHPRLFHENAMYLLWQADAARYESQKTPANRINLLKSANAYLSEFQPNPAYAQKIQGIKEKLPK
jgi:serine/threonine protein kinase